MGPGRQTGPPRRRRPGSSEPNSRDDALSYEFGSTDEPNSRDDDLSCQFGSNTEPNPRDDLSSTEYGSVFEPNSRDNSSSSEFGSFVEPNLRDNAVSSEFGSCRLPHAPALRRRPPPGSLTPPRPFAKAALGLRGPSAQPHPNPGTPSDSAPRSNRAAASPHRQPAYAPQGSSTFLSREECSPQPR